MGDWEKAERCFDEALNVGRDLNEYYPIAEGQTCYGRLFFAKEEYGRAREWLENGLKEYGKAGARWGQEGWSGLLIATLIELGETEKASSLLDKLRVFSQETGDKMEINSEMELRSRLLRAQKKHAESLELFHKTLEEWESIKANIWNAYSFAGFLREYARAYLERDQPGDREKALNLLNRALEMFQKMGAKKDVERTLRLMEGSQLGPQIPTSEKAVGSAGYVCDEVQANIIASPRELKVGESLELEIEVRNTRKEGTILLTRIIEVIPKGFAVAKKRESYRVEGDCLNLKEKRLEPSKTEEVKLVLTPEVQGTFRMKPKILYLDEKGKEKTCEPEPISITVKELGIKRWLKGEK
jgi:tetratricopeptide (TPR) repeat protein